MQRYTIKEFREQFPDDDACLEHIFRLSHASKPCPKCTSVGTYSRIKDRKGYQCSKCSHQIHPMKGTIYEKSRTPLLYWFEAMFLFIKSKNGLSAKELQRVLGVTYKTAYRILMHIRKSMQQDTDQLEGTIEVDETFVGGKNINRHFDKKVKHSRGRAFKDKTPVFGAFQRGGKVKAYVIPDSSAASIKPMVMGNVKKGSCLMSDEWSAYKGLNQWYIHDVVYHNKKQYVNGVTTTNRIENFWSVLKRTIRGSYIQVSRKWLQKYVDECVYRFNNRENPLIYQNLLQASFSTLSSPVRRSLP